MEGIKLIEMAKYCQEKYKADFSDSKKSKYVNTLFAAIYADNSIKCSYTPHILQNATKCILIHKKLSNWYSWYHVEYIDSDGAVLEGNLGNGYRLSIAACCTYDNQIMSLYKDDYEVTECRPPFEDHLQSIWHLYNRCQECSSISEIKLLSRLYNKELDTSILTQKIEDLNLTNKLLEQERDQYKDLLERIKALVENAE
ncbi:MAG: hypothetical protein PHY75_02660 [Bacteroidales bacterium]|nr:hypothetical protein [Bacteroidales bacterium]